MENTTRTGRKSKYVNDVEPYLKDIQRWMDEGIPDKQIAKNLGVAYSTYREYKKKHQALSALVKDKNRERVENIKNSLYKRAIGYKAIEVKVTKEVVELPKDLIPEQALQVLLDNGICLPRLTGEMITTKTTTTTKHIAPDTGACLVLLQQWAKEEGWTRDPQRLMLAKEELKHKKQTAKENW